MVYGGKAKANSGASHYSNWTTSTSSRMFLLARGCMYLWFGKGDVRDTARALRNIKGLVRKWKRGTLATISGFKQR